MSHAFAVVKKRPCRVCGVWFLPTRRGGERQRVCGKAECRRERHRKACEAWRQRHPDYDRDRRLRDKLTAPERALGELGSPTDLAPMGRLDWAVARDAVGLEVSVIIEESSRVLVEWARDAVARQTTEIKAELGRVPGVARRDAIDPGRGPPVASSP